MNKVQLKILLGILLAVFMYAEAAQAKVAPISFEKLVSQSDIIVIGKVRNVTTHPSGFRTAVVEVSEVWKGRPGSTITFLASPTWTCDVSDAKAGETAVLFLQERSKLTPGSLELVNLNQTVELNSIPELMVIAHSGRGRLPIRTVEGKNFGDYWPDVRLPTGLSTIDSSDAEIKFRRSVSIEQLKAKVQEITLAGSL